MSPSQPADASPFIRHSRAFDAVLGRDPEFAVLTNTNAHEGPVYVDARQALYFTTLPVASNAPLAGSIRVAIKRLELDVSHFPFRVRAERTLIADANAANGMTLDHEGRLLVCEQGTRATPARIARVDLDTLQATTIVDNWRGLRFNSPNDIIVARDGAIWFTDPSYGALQKFKDAPMVGDYVYRYDPACDRSACPTARNWCPCQPPISMPNWLRVWPEATAPP